MHDLGYVHRDISAGNVLLVPQGESSSHAPKRGVLADLEYAIKLGTTLPAHDVRTGTPFFMACEVAAHQYLAFDRNARDILHWQLPPFYYNRLHDIESFWWLCMWCVTYFCVNEDRPTETNLRILTQWLFAVPHNFHARHIVLQQFIDIVGLPETQALMVLNDWRKVLWQLYQQVEGMRTTVNDDMTKDVVKVIHPYVDELYRSIGDVQVQMVPSLMLSQQ